MARTRIKLNPALPDLLARAGVGITEFADAAGVSRATIFALLNPAQHPERRGGMHRTTAWKLARAFMRVARLTAAVDAAHAKGKLDDAAYNRALEELERTAYATILVEEAIADVTA